MFCVIASANNSHIDQSLTLKSLETVTTRQFLHINQSEQIVKLEEWLSILQLQNAKKKKMLSAVLGMLLYTVILSKITNLLSDHNLNCLL